MDSIKTSSVRLVFTDYSRIWLAGLLVFLPFQSVVKNMLEGISYNYLAGIVGRIEDITLIILIPFVIKEIYIKRKYVNQLYLVLLSSFILLNISGFVSGILNKNSLFITSLGIYTYIKMLLIIFVYAVFFNDFNQFKKIFRFLLVIAVIIGAVALLQELWALGARYILAKDIHDRGLYLFQDVNLSKINDYWRIGMYRASSIVRHPNFMGLFCLLILTVYLYLNRKINLVVFFSLVGGIFSSVSRLIFSGFIILGTLQIFRGRKWFTVLLIICAVPLIIYLSMLPDFNLFHLLRNSDTIEENNYISYREYSKNKATEVWKDYPLFGVGPGKFGGVVSIIFDSHIYEEYNFQLNVQGGLLKHGKTIDQFWPQVLAEMGLIGAISVAGIFISFFVMFYALRKRTNADEIKGLCTGLSVYTMIILVYTIGGTLMSAAIFIYAAFAGIGLGCMSEEENERTHTLSKRN